MSEYRRVKIPEATYFFTVTTYLRRNIFGNEDNVRILGETARSVRKKHPFHVDAWVVLPDHMHCIWTMPENDSDFSIRWRLIKAGFSKKANHLHAPALADPSRIKRRELTIWHRRFWEHMIRDESDYENHMNYVHFNPVKHNFVKKASEWKWSTFHRYVKLGVYSDDWEIKENPAGAFFD
ncbi:REP-associated tyrosine transposase [Desulforegula conservatrix]|uniref:REP-associated tyrosine transposase n=1 Tax=Desulforegula conservatrix TaxID=153026 RepID=UPI0004175922|nr:transposase [Desulforegula conservatrix]